MMKEIPLTQGKVALVDDEDFERVNQYKWCAYKSRNTYYADSRRTNQSMHRFIMNASDNVQVDHRDHNGLNNQKYNLRFAIENQNNANSRKRLKISTSKFKGITWHKNTKKWQARITVDYKQIYLGLFNNEVDAASAYDEAAIKYFGEFAKLNLEVNYE